LSLVHCGITSSWHTVDTQYIVVKRISALGHKARFLEEGIRRRRGYPFKWHPGPVPSGNPYQEVWAEGRLWIQDGLWKIGKRERAESQRAGLCLVSARLHLTLQGTGRKPLAQLLPPKAQNWCYWDQMDGIKKDETERPGSDGRGLESEQVPVKVK
jgi:hypothetical protein